MKPKSIENGILMTGGINLVSLVKKYGSPLYVYDLEIIREQYQALKQAIPNQVKIFYAIKANPNPNICSFVRSLGAGAEIASSGELYIALKSGFKGKNIIYNSPGKTNEDIEYAINNEVQIINVESMDELLRINLIAQQRQKSVKICIRINPIRMITEAKMQTGGGSQKFGTDEEDIETIIKVALKLEWIDLQGIHIYVGSQILDADILLDNIENTLKIAFNTAEKFGFALQCINFGGGLGVPYSESEPELDIEKFGKGLTALINKIDKKYANINFILEPGRFIVSESGMFLTKVISIKKSRGKNYAIVDGGINHAFLPIRMNKNYPTVIANKMGQSTAKNSNFIIGGPLCTSMDVFTNEVELPQVEINDIICIGNSGAYGFSASMLYFLSEPMPAEVIIKNGKSFIARQRGKKEDFWLNCEIVE
jgi:diaminopimelate decarboxylase